jgi:serine/threonine protein kinase
VVLAVVFGVAGYWGYSKVNEVTRENIAKGLQVMLASNQKALEVWVEARLQAARGIASSPGIRLRTEGLTGVEVVSPESGFLQELRSDLQCLSIASGFDGYLVVDRKGKVLASEGDDLLGEPFEKASELEPVMQGEATLGLPFVPEFPLRPDAGANHPTLFVATPVLGADDESAIAALCLLVSPQELADLFVFGRPGESGETYAFNRDAELLSPSRFEEELKAIGLLPDRQEASSILNVQIRDPGTDLVEGGQAEVRRREQPLTRMAQDAVAGNSGSDSDGYRDYRGVEVLGAWTWLDRYGFGLATEVDAEEALLPNCLMARMFLLLFVLVLGASAALMFSSRWIFLLQCRVNSALDKAQRLGQYTLEEKIGSGGMGTVFRARHALLRRPAALKLLDPGSTTSTNILRFEREVQLTSQLSHPNTVAIFDFGHTPEDVFYYVMEYLEGVDLHRLVTRTGELPEARVIHLLKQVCGSLREAHQRGMIHRDIKPANIILTARGGVQDVIKVVDFGLVKDIERHDITVTADHSFCGTPGYVSPESIKGEPVDGRADLYALGAVGYYLITGSMAYGGGSVQEIIAAQVARAPDPPSKKSKRSISAELERLLLDCLARNASDRPGSAEEFARRLQACPSAGDWDDEQAAAWWEEHQEDVLGTPPSQENNAPASLAIELESRPTL